MSDKLLTVQDVMARLCVSRATVYRLIDRGALVPVRIGRAVRFRESDVARFIATPDQPPH